MQHGIFRSEISIQVDLLQMADVLVGKTESLAEKFLGASVNAVDLVKGGLQKLRSRGKQMVE